jgi:hypothetical protein
VCYTLIGKIFNFRNKIPAGRHLICVWQALK